MLNKDKQINKFYRSDKWKQARALKVALVGGLCELCGSVGEEVHHKVFLTPINIFDDEITINQNNLRLLCKNCHNNEHKRFTKHNRFDANGNLIK